MGCVGNCLLIMVNTIVLSLGLAVVALSSYVIGTTMEYNKLIMEGIMMLPVWTLIGGVALTILSLFGCVGVLKKSSPLLRLYGCLVLMFFAMELVCGILLLVYRDNAGKWVEDRMFRMFRKYGGEDLSLTDSIDAAQHKMKCCGVNTYGDWFPILNGQDVTPGCCTGLGADAETCYKNINVLDHVEIDLRIFQRGCFQAMQEDLEKETLALGIMCIILVVVQLACIGIAFGTARTITRKKEIAKHDISLRG